MRPVQNDLKQGAALALNFFSIRKVQENCEEFGGAHHQLYLFTGWGFVW